MQYSTLAFTPSLGLVKPPVIPWTLRCQAPFTYLSHIRRVAQLHKPSHVVRMSSGKDKPSNQPSDGASPNTQSYITVEKAHEMMRDALSKLDGDIQKLALRCSEGVADAISQCYGSDLSTSAFFVIGPGLNGLIALHTAALLKKKNFEPAVYSCYPSKYVDVQAFCTEHDIDLYDFAPTTLDYYFEVVVDGLLGTGFDGGDIREHFWRIYEILLSTELPIVSVDVPSGWDLTLGPRSMDITADTFIKPEVLVSLGAPKLCAKVFSGSFHFVAGRHVEQEWLIENGIELPSYPMDSNCVLLSSKSFSYQYGNGEVYGKPGKFNATLYTKNPRRKWIDDDEAMEWGDELD